MITKICIILSAMLFRQAASHNLKDWRGFVSSVSSRRIVKHQGREHSQEYPFVVDLTAVDPCTKVTCEAGEVCVVHNINLTRCIPNEEITDLVEDLCLPCQKHHHRSGQPVCGDDGQTYNSHCELDYVACSTDTDIRPQCEGPCPCAETQVIGEPRNMRITSLPNDLTTARIMMTWLPPNGFAENEVEEYIIHYVKNGNSDWSQLHTPGILTSINIAGLSPDSRYYFRTQAVIGKVKGRLSDVMIFNTSPFRSEEYDEAILTDNEDGDITDDEDASGDQQVDV